MANLDGYRRAWVILGDPFAEEPDWIKAASRLASAVKPCTAHPLTLHLRLPTAIFLASLITYSVLCLARFSQYQCYNVLHGSHHLDENSSVFFLCCPLVFSFAFAYFKKLVGGSRIWTLAHAVFTAGVYTYAVLFLSGFFYNGEDGPVALSFFFPRWLQDGPWAIGAFLLSTTTYIGTQALCNYLIKKRISLLVLAFGLMLPIIPWLLPRWVAGMSMPFWAPAIILSSALLAAFVSPARNRHVLLYPLTALIPFFLCSLSYSACQCLMLVRFKTPIWAVPNLIPLTLSAPAAALFGSLLMGGLALVLRRTPPIQAFARMSTSWLPTDQQNLDLDTINRPSTTWTESASGTESQGNVSLADSSADPSAPETRGHSSSAIETGPNRHHSIYALIQATVAAAISLLIGWLGAIMLSSSQSWSSYILKDSIGIISSAYCYFEGTCRFIVPAVWLGCSFAYLMGNRRPGIWMTLFDLTLFGYTLYTVDAQSNEYLGSEKHIDMWTNQLHWAASACMVATLSFAMARRLKSSKNGFLLFTLALLVLTIAQVRCGIPYESWLWMRFFITPSLLFCAAIVPVLALQSATIKSGIAHALRSAWPLLGSVLLFSCLSVVFLLDYLGNPYKLTLSGGASSEILFVVIAFFDLFASTLIIACGGMVGAILLKFKRFIGPAELNPGPTA